MIPPRHGLALRACLTLLVGLAACDVEELPGELDEVADPVESESAELILERAPCPAAAANRVCRAQLEIWQKTAYVDAAGYDARFPAHTTTRLVIHCNDQAFAQCENVNHGTAIAHRQPDGRQTLVRSRVIERLVSVAEATRLRDELCGCECQDGQTRPFISLGALGELAPTAIGDALAAAWDRSCGGPVDGPYIVSLLNHGAWTTVAQLLAACQPDLASIRAFIEDAINRAVMNVAALASGHTCNNDAALQRSVFNGGSCDEATKERDCHPPLLYFGAAGER